MYYFTFFADLTQSFVRYFLQCCSVYVGLQVAKSQAFIFD